MDYVNRVKDDLRHYATDPNREQIFTVISDAKVRQLRSDMERPREPIVLHFSDGTLSLDELDGDEEEGMESGPVVDPVSFRCID